MVFDGPAPENQVPLIGTKRQLNARAVGLHTATRINKLVVDRKQALLIISIEWFDSFAEFRSARNRA